MALCRLGLGFIHLSVYKEACRMAKLAQRMFEEQAIYWQFEKQKFE